MSRGGFVQLPNRLIAEAECSADLAVYAAVAFRRDWKTGVAEVGVKKISDVAHVSKPTALSRLQWLQDRGFLEIDTCAGHSQRRAYKFPDATGQNENRSATEPVFTLTGQDKAPQPVNVETATGKNGNRVLRNKKKRSNATRLPDDFAVTDDHRVFAREGGLPNPDLEIGGFCDYWRARPGKDGMKLDWNATFRNWLRNARSYGVNRHAVHTGNESGAVGRVRRTDDRTTDYFTRRTAAATL